MLIKLPRRWALRLDLCLVVGALLFGVWASKPVLAVGHVQTGDNTGRISGFVKNAEGLPLKGIEVHLLIYDPRPEYSETWPYPWWHASDDVAVSDGTGAYQVSNLPPGVYTLKFSDPSEVYAYTYYGGVTTLAAATKIEVKARQTEKGKDAILIPGGTIHGYIGMFDGIPVSHLSSPLLAPTGDNYIALHNQDSQWPTQVKRIVLTKGALGFSDDAFDLDTSDFTFSGLPPGDYHIEYHVTYGGVRSSGGNAYHEFYPNQLKLEQAAVVSLTPKQMEQRLELIVGEGAAYGRIQGRVTAPDGTPLADIAVHAFPQNTVIKKSTGSTVFPNRFVRSAITNSTGNYELPALVADQYRLHFTPISNGITYLYAPEYYNNSLSWDTATLVEVKAGATTPAINLELASGAQLSGQIRLADGGLLYEADYYPYRKPLVTFKLTHHPQGNQPYQLYLPVTIQSNNQSPLYGINEIYPLYGDPFISPKDDMPNTYSFGGLAQGLYTLEYSLEYLHDSGMPFYWNSPSIPLEVALNAHLSYDIIVPEDAMPNRTVNLTGQVTDETGAPLANIWVNASNVYDCFTYNPCLETNDATDAQGRYALNIAPNTGDYLLTFIDPNGRYAFEHYKDTQLSSMAIQINLAEGESRHNIDNRLAVAGKITGQVKMFDGTPLSQVTGTGSIATGDFSRGQIILSRYVTNTTQPLDSPWQQMRVISISDKSSHYPIGSPFLPESTTRPMFHFDMATNTYTFAELMAGRYRIEVVATHNGHHYSYYADSPGSKIEVTIDAGQTLDNVNTVVGTDNQRVLALYALALDHDPDRIDNLAPQLAPAMQSIIAATRDQPNKTAVVLADAAGVGDTLIYVVRNGRATPVQGLPTAAFQLDPTATEANMADGVTLGNFIRWARNTYPAEVTLFGFVGHGAPLVPATGFDTLVAASGGIRPRTLDSLFPLPTRVGAYPSLTDNHPQALITPYDLATALRIGSNNGADPLQIADVAHCFAASIEELYELSPDGDQPYAEIILASPTYTYLDPPALGEALGAINTLMTPATMADQILQRYDALIDQADQSDGDAEVEHPRLLVAVNSRQVARVKQDWDKVAYHLLQNFDSAKLRQAYQASPHYDTTVCHPQDWSLSPPDALTDLYGFAAALVTVYGADSAVGKAATVVLRDLEDTAILSRYQGNGIPWYAPNGAPLWNFDNHQGIALFADLQGQPTAQAGTVELSWQSRWYTADSLAGENPHPYAFVQNGFNGVTWATVFAEFWRRQPGVTIQTALCFPELASEPRTGELEIIALSAPLTGTVRVGLPFTPTAVVQADRPTLKPVIRFNLYSTNHTLLLSDTVQGGYWLTGTHQLAAARPYTPTAPGDLILEVIVDPANNVSEANEADNRLSQRYSVAQPERFPLVISARLAEPTFFVNQGQVELQALVSPAESATTLVAQLYQFTNSTPSAPWQPTLSTRQSLDLAKPTLPLHGLAPGMVVAHIWARTAQGRYSAQPAVVIFNYAPTNQPLAAGQTHHYWLTTPLTTPVQLDLAVSGDVDLFAWSPFNGWGPEWRMAGSPLILPASALTDGYLLAVTAFADSHYTLTAQPTATTPTTANATPELSQTWPAVRPHFIQPVIDPPGIGVLVAGRQFFLPLTAR